MSKYSFGVRNESFPPTPLPFNRPRKVLSVDMPEWTPAPPPELDLGRLAMPGLADELGRVKEQTAQLYEQEGEQ